MTTTATCPTCGINFVPSRQHWKYCSEVCRDVAGRNRRSAHYKDNREQERHTIGMAHYRKARATGHHGSARRAVNEFVAAGSFAKPEKCHRCWKPVHSRDLHFHHLNHFEPLKGEWICAECHAVETSSRKKGLDRKT